MTRLTSLMEINKMIEDHCLTVKQLKDVIKDLSDDTPVYYQHIEDTYMWQYGWKPLKLLDEESSTDGYKCYDYHHRAFCAYKTKDGKKDILVLTAHY